ncbi:MAG: hypothetical protein IT572_08750 [Deltaproteobacteria bacterium]|nr:hypothetical protein [Deltaproteobacteria bacterium]
MALSRLATVSKDGGLSFDRKHTEAPRSTPGSLLLDALCGGAEERHRFERLLSSSHFLVWKALATETEPKILFQDLLVLTGSLEREGKFAEAEFLYSNISILLDNAPDEYRILQKKSQDSLAAIQGRGSTGTRAELLLRRFCQEATNPAAIASMAVGTQLFRLGRFWAASRLGTTGGGLLPAALANGAGFLAETSSFTLTHKAVASTLGHKQDWSPSGLAREWASGALVLGSLKAMGGATRLGLKSSISSPRLRIAAQEAGIHGIAVGALPQIGMLGGILTGHHLEKFFGLRPRDDGGATVLMDSLATLLHLNVGGSLVGSVLGRSYRQTMAVLDGHYRLWREGPAIPFASNSNRPSILEARVWDDAPTPPRQRPALAGPGPRHSLDSERPAILMMSGESPGGGKKFQFTTEDLARLGKFYAGLSILEAEALDIHYRDQRHQFLFCRLLQNIPFPDRNTQTQTFAKLGHALKHSNDNAYAGSYVNWLTRKTVDALLESQDTKRAWDFLRMMVEGGGLRDFERLAADLLPPARFAFLPPWLTTAGRNQNPSYERIQNLPILSQEAKDVLFRMSYTQAKAKETAPHFLPEQEFLDRIGQSLFHPGYGELIGKALVAAIKSPLPYYRLQRLHALLGITDALTPTKLMELSDPHYQLVGTRHSDLHLPLFGKSKPLQFNGYMGDQAPVDILLELRHRQKDLLDPKRAEARKEARTKLLEQLNAQRARLDPSTPAFWAYGFKLLGDPISKRIAADLEAGKFDLQVLSPEDFKKRCLELDMEDAIGDNAFFLHSGVTGGKPLMLVKEVSFDHYSYKTRNDPVFLVFSKIVHEYQHFLDINPAERRTLGVVHRQEMRAHLRETLWRAQYGDTGKLEAFQREGTGGHAQHWRDLFESLYGHHFKRD